MEQSKLKKILSDVAGGHISADEALTKIKLAPFDDITIANIDTHRGVRQGVSEVIFGGGKSPEQINIIAHKLWENGQRTVLITRMQEEAAHYFVKDIPFTYFKEAKVGLVGEKIKPKHNGYIMIATGGTSDIPVAEEAALTAEILGNRVERVYDVGVAGVHRLLSRAELIMNARVIIAIAGMEGALASVIGGLADCPVIAVPTSVGYGAAFGGVAALLSMLNSCASGVSVVNIDNGFGAGYLAGIINNMDGGKI